MKKVLVIFLVVSIVLMIFNIAAFADTTSTLTNKDYYAAQSYLIDKYCDGEITYEQFQEQSQAVTNEYVTANTVGGVLQGGALNASNTVSALTQKVGSTVDKYGDEAREYVSDWWNSTCNKKGVPTETTQTSNMDMKGYGALALFETDRTVYYRYSDYIVIDRSQSYDSGSGYLNYRYTRYGNIAEYADWSKYDSSLSSWSYSSYSSSGEWFDDIHFKFYGDIRNTDGTQVPTNDEYTTATVKKYDEMTEKQLEDLIDDFSDKMTLENPDLSSLEGLLNAIYTRMGTLDSDNDNELLSSINANILALIEADNNKIEADGSTNEELVETLIEIRDNLKNGNIGSDPNSHGHEISGTVYNVIPLDKNFFNKLFHGDVNLKVEYEGKTYYLEDCGCLKLGNKYYNIDVDYSSSLNIDFDFNNSDFDDFNLNFSGDYNSSNVSFGNLQDLLPDNSRQRNISAYSVETERPFFSNVLTSSQNKKLDKISDMVKDLIAVGVPYDSIQENLSTYQTIIWGNDYVPQDITFTIFDQECTLLSYSKLMSSDGIWEGSDYTEGILIVRAFTSILISFCWVLRMYKKLSSLV